MIQLAELIQDRIGDRWVDLDRAQSSLPDHCLARLLTFQRLESDEVRVDRDLVFEHIEQVRRAARNAEKPVHIRGAPGDTKFPFCLETIPEGLWLVEKFLKLIDQQDEESIFQLVADPANKLGQRHRPKEFHIADIGQKLLLDAGFERLCGGGYQQWQVTVFQQLRNDASLEHACLPAA